jgi:Resolvase, N terminal domain
LFDRKPPHPEPMPTLATIFVAIYVRISKDAQAKGLGVRDQEQDCRKLAERLGWIVYRVFVDNDIRAAKYSNKPRPAYLEMLQAMREGVVQAVLCWDVYRLVRQPKELEEFLDIAEASGITRLGRDAFRRASGQTLRPTNPRRPRSGIVADSYRSRWTGSRTAGSGAMGTATSRGRIGWRWFRMRR